jgi:hypothetical protein
VRSILNPEAAERELLAKVVPLVIGKPLQMVVGVSMNLLVNAIVQNVSSRKQAEAALDELFGKAKTIVLDQHYDPVTGKRRSVVPVAPDHVIEVPFFDNKSEIFPPG